MDAEKKSDENTLAPRVIQFPKTKKRGRKVSKGPAAAIVAFPDMLTGEALCSRWAWLKRHYMYWEQEDTEGCYAERRNWEFELLLEGMVDAASGRISAADEESMRRDIQVFCARIRKRTLILDHLERIGASSNDVATAESALFFVVSKYLPGRALLAGQSNAEPDNGA